MRRRLVIRACLPAIVLLAGEPARSEIAPYDPYADSQEAPAPLAADGTIQWGVFYKSAKIQASYQRLWNLGACRGTNRAITAPVNRNKLIIDRLPEADYEGTVVATAGSLAGGLIAFRDRAAVGKAEPFVVQLHPAGVTRLRATGRSPATILRVGHVIRLVGEVDDKGRAAEPLETVDIVTPPADFIPDPVQPGKRGVIVGEVTRVQGDVLTLHVPAGRIRRLTLTLAGDAVAMIDAARLDLVAPGDAITLRGRLWTGEGSMAAGTIFASDVTLAKPPLAGEAAAGVPVAVAQP